MVNYDTLDFVNTIKDPIWGEIPLTNLEWQLIHTKAFSRLRHVKQMGFAHLAFPGANHTRYEHSIGAMRAAYLLYQMIATRPKAIDDPVALRTLRIAALLHDMGHPPFSHAVEETFRKYPHLLRFCSKSEHVKRLQSVIPDPDRYEHESFSTYVIRAKTEVADLIRSYGIDLELISLLAVGEAKGIGLSALNSLLDGDFDADKIDYIIRDSYYCGLSHKIDLNEFRGKLMIEQVPGGNTFKLVGRPEGLTAIDSLLLARHKLIEQVHNSPEDRIATQMVIETIRLWLDPLPEDDRARHILSMHTDYTDHDLVSLLAAVGRGPNLGAILDGDLFHTAESVPFSKMPPVVKASTHAILNNPTAITAVQDRLRLDFRDDGLLLDIREPKPPKFTTLIRYEEDVDGKTEVSYRNIFDRHYTAHGILMDAFNDLAVYLYSSRTDPLHPLQDQIRQVVAATEGIPESYFKDMKPVEAIVARRLVQAAREVRDRKAAANTVMDMDLLLQVLFVVEVFGRDRLGKRELWINSDSSLQGFLHKTADFCRDEKIVIESALTWDNEKFSSKIFRDFERLINMGLVDHIHKTVPYPKHWWGLRIDRRISGWGKGYVSTELRGGMHPQVSTFVRQCLDAVEGPLKEILMLEEQCAKFDDQDTIRQREPLKIRLAASASN